MYNQLYSKCNSSSSKQCFNCIRTLREQFSASCGNRFCCLRKPIPQCAETYSALCGNCSLTLRVLCPHVAASTVCGNRFPLAAEPFPRHAGIVSAGCRYNYRSVRTRCGIYFSATVPSAWFPDRSNARFPDRFDSLQSERTVPRPI